MNRIHAKKHPLPTSSASPLSGLAFDVEAMLTACVPGGSIVDPQVVADNIRAWAAERKPAELAEQQGDGSLNTSEGGRRYVADFFARELRRHDFTRYITTTLAADVACALAQHLAAPGKQQAGEVQGDAREQFESWAKSKNYSVEHGPDCYVELSTQRTWTGFVAGFAARQPGAQVPVATATQTGKRVSILESACGPARKFDPVAADAELATLPLVPLWDLPELHPRKVAAECLTTMEQARQSTRPNTINRIKLTDAIALVGRFVAQMERSERLGTAPPAQGIDLGQQQDAARWRWVREQNGVTVSVEEADDDGDMAFVSGHTPEELDAAVDSQRDAAPGVDRG